MSIYRRLGRLRGSGDTKIIAIALSILFASCVNIEAARSEEGLIPFKTGVSIDVPVGKLPEPGLYYSWGTQYFSLNVKNDQGANIGVRQRAVLDDNFFVYVPNIPSILGARYGAYLDQTVAFGSTGTKLGTTTNLGLVNAIISPANLSWNLGHGLFASIGLTFLPPGPNYRVSDITHINRPQATIEPNFGLSYLAHGLNLTLHPVVDFNTVNPANGYHSGSVFVMDFSGSYKISKVELGVGGSVATQLTNDQINGVTVASIPGVRGYGNRAQLVSVGPILGYDLGPAVAHVYYTRSVYARNTTGDDRFYFRLDIPIGGMAERKIVRNDTDGAR